MDSSATAKADLPTSRQTSLKWRIVYHRDSRRRRASQPGNYGPPAHTCDRGHIVVSASGLHHFYRLCPGSLGASVLSDRYLCSCCRVPARWHSARKGACGGWRSAMARVPDPGLGRVPNRCAHHFFQLSNTRRCLAMGSSCRGILSKPDSDTIEEGPAQLPKRNSFFRNGHGCALHHPALHL